MDLESLIKRIDRRKNNPEESSATKMGENISCGYLMSLVWIFDGMKKNHNI